ncbi:MAG: DUF1800 family protein [Betaproteobacteria bacterium]
MNASAIALNRFGLGARSDGSLPTDPRGDLLAQVAAAQSLAAPWQQTARTPELLEPWLAQQRAFRQAPEDQRSGIREAYLRQARVAYRMAVGARMDSALQSTAPFVERLVHFWSNHFAVSVDKVLIVGLAGAFENDAIRPQVLGRFEDLLLSALRHPAMLLFLDQAQSVGPSSTVALRQAARSGRPRGLNENLAREIMELHTLGVRSGYTQNDVIELAKALTGWTLPTDESSGKPSASFRFVPALHEPGTRTVVGRNYSDQGEHQAEAIIRDLAAAPATARHIAFKLARHFVADDPPHELVTRLAAKFQQTGGDLPSLYRELIDSPEAWRATGEKFKSPWDWMVSSLRALGRQSLPPAQIIPLMAQLGQPVWRPGSPAGYDDLSATWAAPDALLRRVEIAQRLVAQADRYFDARVLAERILPQGLRDTTARAIASAESGTTSLALLLVSQEFLRR